MKRRRQGMLAIPFVMTAALAAQAAPPGNPPPAKKVLPKATEGAYVEKRSDGTCWEHHSSACPPNMHCNPGPPFEVECPKEATKDKPTRLPPSK